MKRFVLSFTSNFTFSTIKYYFSALTLKLGSMDKKQAVFEQFTLRDYKKWNSSALKTFNNCTIILNNNSDKITAS